ncbi:RNA polymerase sigma factor [Kitasatospora arboriphila]|uniref:RNA polymerase sigma factor n=1 Tax=Kitasatospora arboriphila TaxID=258052 RepID=UPI0031CEE36A
MIYTKLPEYTQPAVEYDGELPEDLQAAEEPEPIEERFDLEKALDELPPKEREYLVEHKGHGHTADDVARRHGVSKGTVTGSARRGLQKLRGSRWLATAIQMAAIGNALHVVIRMIIDMVGGWDW